MTNPNTIAPTTRNQQRRSFRRWTGLAILLVLGLIASCADFRVMSNDEMQASRPALIETYEAIEAHYADMSAYPLSLGDLVPRYLTEVPRDALGRDIEYRLYDDVDVLTPYVVFHQAGECSTCSYSHHSSLGWIWECSGGGCDH